MKKEGSLKIALSILVIVLITLISLGGIFVQSGNIMKNKLPDYKYGMDLKNTNIMSLEVKKEEASEETSEENSEENKEEKAKQEEKEKADKEKYNVKNYNKAKSIIEKRLKIAGANQFVVRLDEQTGNIAVELPTELSSNVSQSICNPGKFEIKIEDNGEVIVDKNGIKTVDTSINTQYADVPEYGSIVELNYTFTKDAMKKLEDIKNNYEMTVEKKTETEDSNGQAAESTEEPEMEDRKIGIYIDGTALYSETLAKFIKYTEGGKLPLTIGGYQHDNEKLEAALQQAQVYKSFVMTENMPVEYTASTTSNIHSNINMKSILIVFALIFLVMFVLLLVKNKLPGVFGALTISGFISTLLLIIRFTNVELTISTIFAIAVMMILQFAYILKVSKGKVSSKEFNDSTFGYMKMLIPVFLMAIAISFAKTIEFIGFGEVVFWGIIVFSIFNNIITRAMLTNVKNK